MRVLLGAGGHDVFARDHCRKHAAYNLPSGKPEGARHRQRGGQLQTTAIAKRNSRSGEQSRPCGLFLYEPDDSRGDETRHSSQQAERHCGAGSGAGSWKS